MIPAKSSRFIVQLFLLLSPMVIVATLAEPLRAEPPQDKPSGFLIREPRVFIGAHLGVNFPNASSDLFSLVTRELTLEKGDFRAAMGGFDVGIPFRSRFAAVISFDYGRTSPNSESRDFVEDNGDPISQTTRFSQMPITGTLRFYPRKLGETIGSYAWVPNRVLPYVGGGGGIVRYSFKQTGRFVDTTTLDIFNATFSSDGFAFTKHVATGVDINLTTRVFANIEARYSWAEANLSGDFTGFQPIDLDGLRVVGGIYFRF